MAAQTSYKGSLSAEQRAFYDREGYLVLPGLLTDGEMQPVRAALQQKVDSIANDLVAAQLVHDPMRGEPFATRLARLFAGLSDQDFLKFGRSWRDRIPGYFDLMSNPKILDAVESLIGPEIFANPVYNVRPKVPKVAAGVVPWHQDKSYWPDANANPVITVWIALVDANHENGCLQLMPRTHKKRLLRYQRETTSGTGYLEVEPAYVRKNKREVVSLPIQAGGAILFNDRLIHCSTANNSDHVRWSVDLRYQPTDQDPMPQHGAGFLARSQAFPQRIATLEDWLAGKPEHEA
ncbi:MAG: phytanoyl-CoA dioxygenase family protein [Deferribacteres bacterium]|nr:phytanoyl-CoA dioxygenase family protein [candidate division KSB1 bacterium]MCB9508573.1 phytanoyl-CoA dioxygenase family protein [Deferribacteres bacterium]